VKKSKSKKKEEEESGGGSDADDESNKSAADSDEEMDQSDDAEISKVTLVDTRIFSIANITVDKLTVYIHLLPCGTFVGLLVGSDIPCPLMKCDAAGIVSGLTALQLALVAVLTKCAEF